MAAKKTEATVEIRPLEIKEIKIRLVGDSPLIVHAWSEKAKRMMLETQMGTTKTKAREKRNPISDFESHAPIKTRAFINVVPGSYNGRFVSTELAMTKIDTRAGVLTRAQQELLAFKEKYGTLTELSHVIAVIDDYMKEAM